MKDLRKFEKNLSKNGSSYFFYVPKEFAEKNNMIEEGIFVYELPRVLLVTRKDTLLNSEEIKRAIEILQLEQELERKNQAYRRFSLGELKQQKETAIKSQVKKMAK
jgi:hypothetical protein